MIRFSNGLGRIIVKIMTILFMSLLLCCNNDQQTKPAKNLKELAIEDSKLKREYLAKDKSEDIKLAEKVEMPKEKPKYIKPNITKILENVSLLEEQIDNGEMGCIRDQPKKLCKIPDVKYISLDSNSIHSKDDISKILNSIALSSLQRQYEYYLRLGHNLKGKITLKFTLKPNGLIENATILSSTTGNQKFDEDIKNRVKLSKKWRKIDNGISTITTLLVFEQN